MYIELKTERLLLRPLDISDLENVHIYASDVENTKYMMHLPNETLRDTLHFLTMATIEWKKDKPNYYEFAITLKGKLIGGISVYLNEQLNEGELGWILNKKYWGQGYATEAAFAIKDFAVNELKVINLVAHCDFRNTPSYKVMKKIGLSLIKDDIPREYPKTKEVSRGLKCSLM